MEALARIQLALVFTLVSLPTLKSFGFGGSSAPLYSKSDAGITLINHANFDSTILHSNSSWMVEFYSSWCGHCIRFAPTFKELGEQVKGTFKIFSKDLFLIILFTFAFRLEIDDTVGRNRLRRWLQCGNVSKLRHYGLPNAQIFSAPSCGYGSGPG